jgi:hypothetical protein
MANRPALVAVADCGGWPAGKLARQLADFAAGLDERFLRGGNHLADAVATMSALLAVLDGMNRALDAQAASRAIAQLHEAASTIEHLPDVLKQRDGDLEHIAEVVRELTAHIDDIGTHLRILDIYGMNIKIAGAGGDFRIFIDDMNGRLETGKAEIAIFAERLLGVLGGLAPVRRAYAKSLKVVSGPSRQAHHQIRGCAERFESHLAQSARRAEELTTLAGRVQVSVSRVLAAIQVADSTRQRIEHVVKAFAIMDEQILAQSPPPAALDQMALLIGALIDSAREDHDCQTQELHQSLSLLATASTDLALLAGSGGVGEGLNSLHELESSIAGIGGITGELATAAAHADDMARNIADAADNLVERLESIDLIVRDVKAIAINTRLLCLRQGQTGVAVAVIAVEVAAQAIRLRASAVRVAAAIERLVGLNRTLRTDGGHDKVDIGAVLDTARQVIAQACHASDEIMNKGEAGLHDLKQQLDQAGAVLGDEGHHAEVLRQGATMLNRPTPNLGDHDNDWLRLTMPKLGALYTMASERQIHSTFAPRDDVATDLDTDAVPVTPVVEQDDDGFF